MNEIVYNSGSNIWDESYLATLSVFYEKIHLPAISTPNHGGMIVFDRPKGSTEKWRLSGVDFSGIGASVNGKVLDMDEYVQSWEKQKSILFEAGVLCRLNATKQPVEPRDVWNELETLSDIILDIPHHVASSATSYDYSKSKNPIGVELDTIFIWYDHAFHLLRNDVSIPGLFLTKGSQLNREILKSLLAHSTFRFVLPKLSKLHPEEILKVREEVKDTREGFSMHLQSLSAEVESRLKEGDKFTDVAKYARSVVETKLIPDYFEFKRQLSAKRAGFWGRVLDKVSNVAEIDSAPWTPKFYAELVKALGFTLLSTLSERQESLSNKNQAYQFIKTVQENIS
jgi:hypothetical protein